MDYRRDVFPPALALLLSLALHGALMGWHGWVSRDSSPELDTVAIELLTGEGDSGASGEEARSAEEPAAPTRAEEPVAPRVEAPVAPPVEAEPPVPRTVARVRLPPPEPPKPVQAPEQPRPAATPPPLPAPETASAPTAPTPVETESAPPTKPVEMPTAPAPSAAAPSAVPPLQDLLPRGEELAAFNRSEAPPDPAGGEAREATLALGESDTRYRGYLQRVQNSIDVSWRWREAILAAGRGGTVLLRFTLTPGGKVDRVEVVDGSGSPLLDREAGEAVKRAPMPSFPEHWTIERLHLYAQFDYRLE